ncbi:MAG: phospholipid carrier-dependent glycosyltransferase [Oscillospiraceae bacterium]|jgi:4-amino-4-deoxy-L-arabinose transferase-like glycosyltransferase|nr:phospholipid carrier-dependent glycosyltransferase [Oscillospiraceae bacterium]
MRVEYLTVIYPIITVACLVLFFRYYVYASRSPGVTLEWIDWALRRRRFEFAPRRYPLEFRKDAAPIALITVVFAVLAFAGLGDADAPQSYYSFADGSDAVVLTLDRETDIGDVMFYTGLWTGHYTLEFSTDGTNWQAQLPADDNKFAMDQPYSHLFKWRYADINEDNPPTRYIRLTASNFPMELGELALFDAEGGNIPPGRVTFDARAGALFDEQGLVPPFPSYMNSMYFDEIYHGRAAFENLRGVYSNENSHPPLGKAIISVGITLFGMTPFGWRFMGALFGVLMLPVFYVLLKNMFGKRAVAVCGTLLFGFEFMRFVQTRIATIDTYGVFFILLAYLFMFRYITYDRDASAGRTLPNLALCGLAFGVGCASKWIVVYAGAGLAVMFALRLAAVRRHYADSEKRGFGAYLVKTLLFSVFVFIAVPAAIYVLSYIPNGTASGMALETGMLKDPGYYKMIWDNQVFMFSYHSELVAEHSYASRWYQWITDARPILYFRRISEDGAMKSAFAAFGNPVVWWGGFMAMAAMAFRAVKRHDRTALFIVIGYLSQLVPWMLIPRIVFVYHYFPSTLFLILALAHVFNTLIDNEYGRYKRAVYGFTAAAGALFALFYPVLTGVNVPQWYTRYVLRWIPGAWPF